MKSCISMLKRVTNVRFKSSQLQCNRTFANVSGEKSTNICKVGFSTVSGRSQNKENEDRFIIESLSSGVNFFGIFDGHNGDYVSEYLKNNLVVLIEKRLSQRSLDELVFASAEEIFLQSFKECQKRLEESLRNEKELLRKDIIGSTAVVALLFDNKYLSTANVGDSKVLVCDHGLPVELSIEHHPGNIKEAERIEKKGGWIDWDSRFKPLVNGRLSMTRSFGNLQLRSAGVISTPTVRHKIVENDRFLLLCSDGISHTIADPHIVSIINSHENANEACHDLTTSAHQYGSDDDVTAIVVPLNKWDEREPGGVETNYSLFRTMVGSRSGG